MKTIYVWTGDYRSFGYSPDLWSGATIPVEVPDDFSGGNKTYDPKTGIWTTDPIAPHDYVAEATAQKNELLALYRQVTANWNTDLLLGDISEEDRAKLKEWVAWRKSVESIDVSTASEEAPITFPEHP